MKWLKRPNASIIQAGCRPLPVELIAEDVDVSALVAELERELIRERVIAGIRRAQAQGKHVGRKKVEIDLRPAVAMLDKGHGIKTTARSLGVSISTLRRRLREAGEWPRPDPVAAGVQNPPAQV